MSNVNIKRMVENSRTNAAVHTLHLPPMEQP